MVTFGRVAVDELVNSPLLTIGIHFLKVYYKALMSLKSTGGLRTADVGIEPGVLLRWVVSRIPSPSNTPPCNQGQKSVSVYDTCMLRRTGVGPWATRDGSRSNRKNGGTDEKTFVSISDDPRARPVERGECICPGHRKRYNPGNGD